MLKGTYPQVGAQKIAERRHSWILLLNGENVNLSEVYIFQEEQYTFEIWKKELLQL
jgi:hypothetical protein